MVFRKKAKVDRIAMEDIPHTPQVEEEYEVLPPKTKAKPKEQPQQAVEDEEAFHEFQESLDAMTGHLERIYVLIKKLKEL